VGSTAVALVAHGDCAFAVIRGATADASPPAEGPVVVGVDGSPTSDAAIATTFDEASWRGAELVAAVVQAMTPGRRGIVAFGAGWSWVEETKDLRRRAVRRCRALSAARIVVPGSHAPRR
jgi:nucleotide-binding universal stress UspA family protein